jgi:3-dehydrotetronate 4-kinase
VTPATPAGVGRRAGRDVTLGVIADDFTGATDVASMLVGAGMRTVQVIGVPSGPCPDADAVVVALKSRTAPVDEAVDQALAALRWLQAGGARQCYLKICSTFDSTPQGNIGPVAEALMAALGTDFAIACPAFPQAGRTVYRGHLFVGDQLLSDSGMREHPLTPMIDANLVNVLQAQSRGGVGLVRYDTVAQGVDAVRQRCAALRSQGTRLALVDAVDDDALRTIAAACADHPLLVAGSGVALGLPAVYERQGWIRLDAQAARLDDVGGHAAVLSGSCSSATRAQVEHWLAAGRPALRIDARELAAGEPVVARVLAWSHDCSRDGPVLVYATAGPDEMRAVQSKLGVEQAGRLLEQALARIAHGLVENGVRRLVVAGGETSGAVVQALGVTQLRIGAAIAPGVPWTQVDGRPLQLALKSGNFGDSGFFERALQP